MLAAFAAACFAANGVPLRDPRKPNEPELFHASTLPVMSEMVTMVLLKDACTCTSPCGTCLRSFFLNVFFLPFFSGAAVPPAATGLAIMSVQCSVASGQFCQGFTGHWTLNTASRFSTSLSSWSTQYLCAGPCECARWCAYAVPAPANCGGDGIRDRIRFR